jgi:hypothetical protein
MTEELKYDPKSKRIIKEAMFAFLYQPLEVSTHKRLKTLIIKNSLLYGNNQHCLSYRGKEYAIDADSKRPRAMNRLKAELRPLMDEYLEDLVEINTVERPYVLGFINQTLNASSSLQDYLKIFPESMHKPLKHFIDTCGSRVGKLEPETIADIRHKNLIPIELMKKRMVLNLLI